MSGRRYGASIARTNALSPLLVWLFAAKQQDKVLAIFDLRGFSAFGLDSNADFEFAKFLVSLLYIYYPRRVGQVLLVGAPAVFRPVWSVVRPWLRSYGELVSKLDAIE